METLMGGEGQRETNSQLNCMFYRKWAIIYGISDTYSIKCNNFQLNGKGLFAATA